MYLITFSKDRPTDRYLFYQILIGVFFIFKDNYTTTGDNGKHVSAANTDSAAGAKKARMDLVQSPLSSNRKIVWYYAKNIGNVQNHVDFFRSPKPELNNLLKTCN